MDKRHPAPLSAQILRLKGRKGAFLKVAAILVLIQLLYLFSYSTRSKTSAPIEQVFEASSDISGLDVSKYLKTEISSVNSSQNLLEQMKSTLSLQEKCDVFSYYINSDRFKSWDPEEDKEYTPSAFDKQVYTSRESQKKLKDATEHEKERIRNEYREKGETISDEDLEGVILDLKLTLTREQLEEIEAERVKLQEKSVQMEEMKLERATNMRLFGKCFFDKVHDEAKQVVGFSKNVCGSTERNILPFLAFKFPKYTRWNGKKYDGIPYIDNIVKNEDIRAQKGTYSSDLLSETSDHPDLGCFITAFHKSLNGKGIVISMSDSYTDEALRFLRVARALGNTIPIQIVHKGDLSVENQRLIIKTARGSLSRVLKSTKLSKQAFSKAHYRDYVDPKFPPQEVWFVDVSECIAAPYASFFDGFANKLLAFMFNSFEEVMLIDTDTVPLVPINKLFELQQYIDKGALFFRDRDGEELLWEFEAKFWRKLLPKSVEQTQFEIPKITDFSLTNRYLGDYRKHYMEAGLVLMNRATHFPGVLMVLELALWKYTTHEKYWGDKEMFWLAQTLVGNENYYMNSNQAGSAGELRSVAGKKSHEVCATHPGHVSDEDNSTLLWINSGFNNCKKDTWESDCRNERFAGTDLAVSTNLKAYYDDYTRITGVIVPPQTDYFYVNNLYEPFYGWYKVNICNGHYWCAYDVIAGSEDPKDRGILVQFDNDTVDFYNFVGRLWTGL